MVTYPGLVDLSHAARSTDGALDDLVRTATGQAHRADPLRGRTGGPAGNARLTSWTGLVLLVVLAVEGFTLLSLGQLLGVHILIGALLVPVVLLKSASTGWRIARYYTGDADYVAAGPPPLVLRLLGPLVVLASLAVLGTGLALIAMGSDSFRTLVALPGLGVSMVTLHQLSFVGWFAVMTLHVLGRTIPALREVTSRRAKGNGTPGGSARGGLLAASLAAGVVVGILVLGASSWWTATWQHHR